MNLYVILDLDGCISDDRHRVHLIDHTAPDPWEAYHAACQGDSLMNAKFLNLGRYHQPIIFTARPEKFRTQTLQWLRDVAKIAPAQIYMRPQGCKKISPELKAGFLEQFFATGVKARDIVFAVDDRDDVIDVYERYHIPTFKSTYPEEQLHESN